MGDVINDRKKYERGWSGGLPETPCGFGSKVANTAAQREWIPDVVQRYRVNTIADIGAGDLNWWPLIEWRYHAEPVVTHYDLVPRHPEVVEFDLLADVPDSVDMIVCLWVLNHLPSDACIRALDHIIASGSRYLMTTDRPRWHGEQPDEFLDLVAEDGLEHLTLDRIKGDAIHLIDLQRARER